MELKRYIFSFLCVCLPVLSIYVSPIPGVELGTFLLLLFTPYFLIKSKNWTLFCPKPFLIVIIYIFICTLLGLASGIYYSYPETIVMRLLRFVLLLTIVVIFGIPNLYNKVIFISILSKVSLLVAIYAIVQYVSYYYFGVQLVNTFGPTKQLDASNHFVDMVYRPQSFFMEPSSAAYFLAPYLCYVLFAKEKMSDNKYLLEAFIISIGVLCTTSGQGLLVVAFFWCLWLVVQIKNHKFWIVVIFGIVLYFTLQIFDVSYTIERVVTTENQSAIDARSKGYDMIKSMPIRELVLGNGFGNYLETVYFSSFAEIIFCLGYVGFFLVIAMYLQAFRTGTLFQRTLVLASFILMSGGGIFTASFLCLYLPMIYCKNEPPHIVNHKDMDEY